MRNNHIINLPTNIFIWRIEAVPGDPSGFRVQHPTLLDRAEFFLNNCTDTPPYTPQTVKPSENLRHGPQIFKGTIKERTDKKELMKAVK